LAEPVADPTLDLGRARARVGLAAVAVVCALTLGTGCAAMASDDDAIELPEPNRDGDVSVERALALRRSRREFAPEPLSLANASQLLWAAQGVSGSKGRRTAPSAGALYPLEVYLVAGAVSGLPPGVYHYEPEPHRLVRTVAGDVRAQVAKAALAQDWIAEAPAIVVIAGVHHRTAWKYWKRAPRYVHMEAGHAAQNVYLQAVALGLGTTMVGAFRDDALAEVLDLPSLTEPLGLLPVGPYRKP
jgi:SagB-type dehydrogenase family enzyme